MNKFLKKSSGTFIPSIIIVFALITIFIPTSLDVDGDRIAKEEFLRKAETTQMSYDEWAAIDKRDRPDLAVLQDFYATMNPQLGRPTPEVLGKAYARIQKQKRNLKTAPGSSSIPWVERGPDNFGGRTRALIFDPNDVSGKAVIAGGVAGGLWTNSDITSSSTMWQIVDGFWSNIAISCIDFDPNNTQVMYVGTGEGWYNGGAVRGNGIWKTSDGGTTWAQLSITNNNPDFHYVNKIRVIPSGPNAGRVVVATRSSQFGRGGILYSDDGGANWTNITANPGLGVRAADIEIAANGDLYASVGISNSDGIYKSTNDGTSWTKVYSSSGSQQRIELACAPSNANVIYALVADNPTPAILKSTDGGNNWSAVSNPAWVDQSCGSTSPDWTRTQDWYDLIAAVDPNDENRVFIGGIDLLVSADGGTNWTQLTSWAARCSRQYVHADQHAIYFKPGSSTEILFGNDGGVAYTSNGTAAIPTINHQNNGYNVTQFYACAMHPNAGQDTYFAGAQDNGSHRFNSVGMNSTVEVTGGDGGFCFVDQTNANYVITSYTNNQYRVSVAGGGPGTFSNVNVSGSKGRFINPGDYDDNMDILYSAWDADEINRVMMDGTTSPPTDQLAVPSMGSTPTHFRVSPYTTTSTTLFVGTGAGRVFRIENANTSSPTSVEITGTLQANYISCIEIGANEDELIVTFSNYGVQSVFYTTDGGGTWTNKDTDLPDLPVRWALFNPDDRNEVILATEMGVWSTANFLSGSPNWVASSNGMAHCRVDMLQIRDSDKQIAAATHGRGLFTSSFASLSPPVANFQADNVIPCINSTVNFTDLSSGTPNAWLWSVSPGTHTYVGGTNSGSRNPQIQFNAYGTYRVELTVQNPHGIDTETKTAYITVQNAKTLPFSETFESSTTQNEWNIENPDNKTTWSFAGVGGNTPGNTAAFVDNNNYTEASGGLELRDGLISPQLDFSGSYVSISMDFEHAYRAYDAVTQDSLVVYISTDCGASWQQLALYKEGDLKTGPDDATSQFYPTIADDWCDNGIYATCKAINLDSYIGEQSVSIKFENISNYGNNLFLDNINIIGLLPQPPIPDFTATPRNICEGDAVQFVDQSTAAPTSWLWSVAPNSGVTFTGSNTDQNPEISFSESGIYAITLLVTNSEGSNQTTELNYITVDAVETPEIVITPPSTTICDGDEITFSSTVNFGGDNPTIEWFVEGISSHTGETFTTTTLNNNDVVHAELTSDRKCKTTALVSSSDVTMTVKPYLLPEIDLLANSSFICDGEEVNINASISNGGDNPMVKWFIDGDSVFTGLSYQSNEISDRSTFICELISDEQCVVSRNVFSDPLSFAVKQNVTPIVTIYPDKQTLCEGEEVVFSSAVFNGGNSPLVHWYVDSVKVSTGLSYTYQPSNADSVMAEVVSSEVCVTSSNEFSRETELEVRTYMDPEIDIEFIGDSACTGEEAIFLTDLYYGGLNPVIEWYVNGEVLVKSRNLNTSSLLPGDAVYARLVSNDPCAATNVAFSELISPTVYPKVQSAIQIVQDDKEICEGKSASFSVASLSGNSSTSQIEWHIDGEIVEANAMNILIPTPVSGSTVQAYLNTDTACVTESRVGSNAQVIDVQPDFDLSVSLSQNKNTLCNGESIVLIPSVSPDSTIQSFDWFNSIGAKIHTGSALNYTPTDGEYVEVVANYLACNDEIKTVGSGTFTFTVNPLPGVPDIFVQGDSLFTSAVSSTYVWYKDNFLVKSGSENFLENVGIGTYYLAVVSAENCSTNSETIVIQSIDEYDEFGVNIFPVPVKNTLYLESNGKITELKIVDGMGKVLFVPVQDSKEESGGKVIDVSMLSNGVYYLMIQSEGKWLSKRFSVLK